MKSHERLISAGKLVSKLAKKNYTGMIHYDDILATIADLPTVEAGDLTPEWISVKDRLPEEMDVMEKLVELLKANFYEEYEFEEIADHLIAHGVTVQERGNWKYYHKQNKAVCTSCSFERDLDANFGKAIACPNCGAYMPQPPKRE